MATHKSKAFLGGVPFRPTADKPFQVAATVLIPNGTALAANDVLQMMKIGANVRILDVTLITDDLDTAAAITLDVGYKAAVAADVVDFFIDGSTIGQTGGVVRVENGGDDPFADGSFVGVDETLDIEIKVAVAPTGDPTTDRYITLMVTGVAETTTYTQTPYVYADRYDADGVGTV